jgi:hypothetical protein
MFVIGIIIFPLRIKFKVDRKVILSTLNQPFQRATLSIDRRNFQTVRAFMAAHGNDPTEPTAAWAVGRQDVTSRHEGRDKDN